MYGMIVANLSFEPKSIIRHVQEKYKYTISYGKAWSAKQIIMCVCNCNCDLAFIYSLLYSLRMFLIYVSYLIFHADMAQTPELLDANTDVRHRSYLAALEGQQLHELRPRVAKELLHLDDRWLDR
jgi:hypothetical protein